MNKIIKVLKENQLKSNDIWKTMEKAKNDLEKHLKDNYFKDLEVHGDYIPNRLVISCRTKDVQFTFSLDYVIKKINGISKGPMSEENNDKVTKLIKDLGGENNE